MAMTVRQKRALARNLRSTVFEVCVCVGVLASLQWAVKHPEHVACRRVGERRERRERQRGGYAGGNQQPTAQTPLPARARRIAVYTGPLVWDASDPEYASVVIGRETSSLSDRGDAER
jgi:hypothetical protein